mgnify:CR=1 FL=1
MLLLVLGICLFASLCLQKRVPQIINPIVKLAAGVSVVAVSAMSALAQEPAHRPGGEANLILPDLSSAHMLGTDGRTAVIEMARDTMAKLNTEKQRRNHV